MAEASGGHAPQAYFDTPERAERLQLVAHLVRNTEAIPYIRGPKGAGKTRFAERLAAIFRQEATLALLDGNSASDVPHAICQALGITVDRWPGCLIDAVPDHRLMVMVDDVDHLDGAALQALETLRDEGARLIFLGSSDPATLPGAWDLQLIDLPPFSERQLRDFLDFLGHAEAVLLKDTELARLHRASKGQPGAAIAVLAGGKATEADSRPLPWRWLLGVAAALLVVLVLWQQDRINALFEPPADVTAQSEVPAEPGGAVEAVAEKPEEVAEPSPQAVAAGATPAATPSLPVVDAPQALQAPASDQQSPAQQAEIASATEEAPVPLPEPEPPAEAVRTVQEAVAAAAQVTAEPDTGVEPPAVPSALPPVAVEPLSPAGPRDMAWLLSRQPKSITLQLVGARDRAAIDAFIREHGLAGDYVVYERELSGKPWYSLIYGDYAGLEAALRARDALPAALHEAWPRSFESVWQQLPAGSAAQ